MSLPGQDAAISMKAPLFPIGLPDFQTLRLSLTCRSNEDVVPERQIPFAKVL
jgi:hypothetical protein